MIKKLVKTIKHPSAAIRVERKIEEPERNIELDTLIKYPELRIQGILRAIKNSCQTRENEKCQYTELTQRDLDYTIECTKETQKNRTW